MERTASSGFAARYPSTARISVVLPVPDEPIIRMLPTRSPASFFERAIAISRTASPCPITRSPRAAAISRGEGIPEVTPES